MAGEHRTRDAAIWGAALGAAAGAVLVPDAALGAVAGAVLSAVAHGVAARTQRPAAPGPLWGRVLASAELMALLGALLPGGLVAGLVSGALVGALGLRPLKLVLGVAIGGAVGALGLAGALTAALVTVVYRLCSAWIYRKRPMVRIMAERVPPEELPYVVPFEALSGSVGADYVEQLAHVRGGRFERNPPDVGILASLDSLAGPAFDPRSVHPLVREFYEHTSRFTLSIVPEWRTWMKPLYALFKATVAEPLGQAAIPSNIEQAQRGMVSTIDTIAVDGEISIRGWIRTFADSGEPIYVGIYTSFRHEDRGYVSVGFPIPGSNFTATLEPRNLRGDGLQLTSRSALPFPGHYLSAVEDGRFTVLKLLAFHEWIEVFVAGGRLRTEHSFSLLGARFLTLHYEIARSAARTP
ncbi:MAG TPA: hypothetical protein VNS09_17180 [Solirubrobacter sp.]|nr:hypothetical protein [Solirubrobacter sp.]